MTDGRMPGIMMDVALGWGRVEYFRGYKSESRIISQVQQRVQLSAAFQTSNFKASKY